MNLRCSVAIPSAAQKPTIGFIGLGNMGGHMAHNLIKKGYPLVVFDLSKDAVSLALSRGAQKAANTPAEVAQASSIIVTMLPSSPHVRQVYLTDANSIVNGLKRRADGGKSAFLLDSSTIDPTAARSVAAEVSKAIGGDAAMLDAPVSGGVLGAEAGTLTFMVGASKPNFDKAKVILECMGKNIVHCGDSGTGQVAKVCNNLILAISMAGVSEAMNLGVKLGADPKVLASIVNTSSGRCWSSDTYNPVPGVLPTVPSSREYSGGFAVDLMKKDIGLALDAAKQAHAELPLGNKTFNLYEQLSKQQLGGKDFSVVYDALKKNLVK